MMRVYLKLPFLGTVTHFGLSLLQHLIINWWRSKKIEEHRKLDTIDDVVEQMKQAVRLDGPNL